MKARWAWAWWVTIAGALCFVAWQILHVFVSVQNGVAADVVWIVAGSTLVLSLTGVALWIRPQSIRLQVLRSRYPKKLVLGVQTLPSTGDQIASVLGVPLRALANGIGTYSVLVADQEGVSIWKGASTPVRRYLIPWKLMSRVSAGTSMMARPLPTVELLVASELGRELLSFAPCREGWLVAFAHLNPAAAAEAAASIERLRHASL